MDFRKKTTLSKIPRQLLAEKIPSLFLVIVFSLLCNLSSTVAQTAPFITEWTTTSADESITIPTAGSGYDYLIDWGDETSTSGTSSNPSHTYAAPGTYTVQISGDFPRIYFNDLPNGLKLTKILQWGDIAWSSMENAFFGCENMILVATDAPDLSNVSSTSRMFASCNLELFAVNTFEGWDVGTIEDMSYMFFSDASTVIPVNLGTWDVRNVRDMSSMFERGSIGPITQIDQWEVIGVTNMSNMFTRSRLSININSWNVGNVTNMLGMFAGAIVERNVELGDWDVGNVTNMSSLFSSSEVLSWNELGLENWDVSNVRQMDLMFRKCDDVNVEIGDWEVGNVTTMEGMFAFTSLFNRDLNSWDVSKVTNMERMFEWSSRFNQDLSSWDVSNVTNMKKMFSRADDFDQSLGAWDVSNVTNMEDMLENIRLSTANYDATLQGWAALPVLQPNVSFNAGDSQYCLGEDSRDILDSNFNWTISDGLIAENCNDAQVSCPADITTTIDLGSCAAVVDFLVEIIADNNSGDFMQTEGLASGSAFPLGTTINTFTVTEYPNNTCSFSVTVLDDVPPVPDMTSLPTFTGACEVVVNGAPTATDDCAGQLVGTTTDPLVYSTQGEYTITWTYDDGNGNTSTQNQTIIIADQLAPTAICKNFTVEIGADGTGSLAAEDINGGSFDNCGIASMTTNAGAAFNCTAVGKGTTITLTVTDFAGNSDNCTASVDFVDATPPTVVCQDITVQLDASGTGSYLNTDLDGGSSDNCGFGPGSISFNLVTCNNIGTFQSTLVRTDQSGNSASCKANVTVVDQVAPTASCQNITVGLDAQGNAMVTPSAVNNGSSDACGIAELSLNISSFDCSNVGANTVQLSVVDNSGNTSTCEAVVTIVDQVAPKALCKNITVALNAQGRATITPFDVNGGSNDNCGIADLSLNKSRFDCFEKGFNTVRLSATDVSGNSSVCTARVRVVDNTAPKLKCKDVTVELNRNGVASFFSTMVVDIISDNCRVLPLPLGLFNVNCEDVGSVKPITIRAQDNSGNQSSCVGRVSIVDRRSPEALCQDLTVQLDETGKVDITAAAIDNGSNDACGLTNMSLDVSSFDCSNLGNNAVELTVTDPSGNSSSCSATVTVEDNIAPQALCQHVTIQLDETGNGSLTAAAIDNGSSDACGLANMSLDISSFDCSHLGDNTVHLSVTDLNGNARSCKATVKVEDNIAPVLQCKDVTVSLNGDGFASFRTDIVVEEMSDNCGLVPQPIPIFEGFCPLPGFAFPITLFAEDLSGNRSSCTANISVVDDRSPQALCQDVTVQLDDTGNGSITAAAINNGSSDNCGIADLSLDRSSFDCDNLGENTVELTVTDPSGNSNSCSAIVTVEDNIAPQALCQDLTIHLDETGNGSITAAAINNGSTDACGLANLSLNQSSFTCDEVGLNTVTLTATDSNGNSASCQATVIVEDKMAPTALCQDITLDLNPEGVVTVSAADIDNGSTDNCDIVSLSASLTHFTPTEIGSNPVELTVTDANGNNSSCSATVTINPVVIANVWDDQDGDGKQDNEEPAIADAKVELIDHSTGNVLQELLTNLNGEAIFSVGDIAPGQRLRLKFYEKADHRFGLKDQGNNDNIDSDASRSTGLTTAFTLDVDGLTDKWDAALWAPGSVQAFVWDDQDGDGKQDEGEPGLSGATVDLLESNGDLIASTTTNGEGLTSFSNVPADRAVRLKFHELPNLSLTKKDQGNNDNIDSDASRSNGLTGTFQANRGNQVFDSWDAGMLSSATVKAYVWDDQDGDGKQDVGEPAIAEARVDLLETDGTLIETAQTDASGFATFENVPTDRAVKLQFFEKVDHRFTQKDQGNNDNIDSDASRSSGLTASFQASTGNQLIEQWDAGLWAPGQVQAFVWDDRDGDGKQDEGEPGIKGVEVHLLESDNQLLQTAYSNDAGVVTFTDVPANRPVKLQFVELGDFRFTLKDQGNNDNIDSDASRSTGITGTFQATRGSQTISSWDAGLWSPGHVQAFVWDDLDGDGKQDADEPGLANVQVNLLEQGGTLISTTNTNAEGIATFNNVPADRFVKLQFFEPADQRFTHKDQGSNDNIDSDASRSSGITSAFQASQGAQVHEKVDCGLWSQGEVEAFVWNDLDGDGKQDEGEPGIEGVIVDLLESSNELIISTSTDENGLAVFFDVPADRAVKLRFQAPTGYSITVRDQGNNDNIDSDAKPSNGLTGTFQATMGQQLFTSWDAGLVAINTARVAPESNETQTSTVALPSAGESTIGSIDLAVFPNPFSIRTTILYEIADRAEVAIDIYDMNGRQISRLFQGEQGAGQHSLEWDGSGSAGEQLPAGIYLVQMRFDSEVINKRIVLQR